MWSSQWSSRSSAVVPVLAVLTALAGTSLTACAPSQDDGVPGEAGGAGERVAVLASFYPLQYVAERVGGDLVEVASLTPPGAEPHDLELSPRQVSEVGDADVVLYLAGFQPAADEAIAAQKPDRLVDAAANPAVAAHGADPHFWLDPTLLAEVAGDVADELADADPENAATYRERAADLSADLTALDEDFSEGLATCERRVVVTAHEAFGFLADRYDLEQVGISGLDPEAEPSPARLREIGDVVEQHGVTTLFTEELLNPKVSETLADDLGVLTAVLDPVESQVDPATDYRGAMERNLAALREALGCT